LICWATTEANRRTEEDGNVCVCWTRFNFGGEIRFSRSLDEGLTFQDEQVISRPIDFFPFGCHIDVGPNSEVYVAYSDRGAGFPIIFRRSLDGGLTWLAPVQVNSLPIRQPGLVPIIRVTDTSFPVPPINPNFDRAILPCYMGEYIAVAANADNFY
jgi:hypothetical protein